METVCHVITKLELGGAQEVALYTVSHLDSTKYRPILVTGSGGLLTEEACRLPGVQTIIVPSLGRRIHAVSDIVALAKMIMLFRTLRPRIVHTHSSKAGILGRWAAWFAGVPVIIHTVHGFGITPVQPGWVQRLFMLLERMTGWVTTHWIAVSYVDVAKGRQWGLFDKNVSVMRPGIDPIPFQRPIESSLRNTIRQTFGAGPHDVLIGTVACLKPQKAPEDFVLVAKRICDAMPQARFVLVGDGELRSHVETLIHKHQLQGRLYLAGWRRDIDVVMKSFDVFLLTSHWEGLPRVILEAVATGLPIIATNTGGITEAVAGINNVRLYEPGDVEGMATGVRALLQRHESIDVPKRLVPTSYPIEFHITEMVKRYESLYDTFLSHPNIPPIYDLFGRVHHP